MLPLGKFIEWDDGRVDRIIGVNLQDDLVWLIDIYDPTAIPREDCYTEVDLCIRDKDGTASIKPENPFSEIRAFNIERLTKAEREFIKHNWQMYQDALDIVEGENINPFSKPGWLRIMRLLRKTMRKRDDKETPPDAKTCRKYLRRFLKMNHQNALVDQRHIYSGAPGKERTYAEDSSKSGTYRRTDDPEIGLREGVPVTEEDKKNFQRAVDLFGKKNKFVVTKIYDDMRNAFYTEGEYTKRDGIVVPIVLDRASMPTIYQFRYWFNKNIKKRTISRSLNRFRHNMNQRAFLGRAQDFFNSPSIYTIDFTTLHLNLTNLDNPNKVSRQPTICAIGAPFSGLCVHAGITLEPGSYKTFIGSFVDACIEKVKVAKRYGLDIDEHEMPIHHVPTILLVDRAPYLLGEGAEIIKSAGIVVTTANAYGAEKNGSLEHIHFLLEEGLFSKLPGFQKGRKEKGKKDQRPKARLSYESLRYLLMKEVIDYNTDTYLENYPMTEGMIEDGIDPTPLEIQKWGMKYIAPMREGDEKELWLDLMPRVDVPITPKGLVVRTETGGKKYRYSCKQAREEKWFEDAHYLSNSLKASYHPDYPDYIFLHPNKEYGIRSMLKCELIPSADMEPFRTLPFVFGNDHRQSVLIRKDQTEHQRAQKKAERQAYREAEIAKAEAYYQENNDGRGDSGRIKNMDENTREEIARIREVNRPKIFYSDDKTQRKSMTSPASQNDPDETYIPPENDPDMFSNIWDEKDDKDA